MALVLMACVVLLGTAGPVLAAPTAVVVTPSSPNGWYFYDDGLPGGIATFVSGPGTPPLSTGSVRMVLTGTARQTIMTPAYAGTRFDKISNLQYYTYGSGVNVQFDIDFDLTDSVLSAGPNYMGRLVYQPSGGITSGGWTQWNPKTGSWYTTAAAGKAFVGGLAGNSVCGASCTWAQVLSSYPNAGISVNYGGTFLKAGGPAPGFDGNVDAFNIAITGGADKTYDFEPGSTGLVFAPVVSNVSVGGTTQVAININSVANLYGYQFQVNFDQTKVTAVAAPFTAFVNTWFNATGGGVPDWNATCNNTLGYCRFSATLLNPAPAVNGSGTVAVITFLGGTLGTVPLTFASGEILTDRGAVLITHVAGTGTLNVYGTTTVSGNVNLQGRSTPIDSGTVTLSDLGNNFSPMITTFSPTTGNFSFSSVPVVAGGSNYQFDAAHSLYLGNVLTQTLVAGVPYAASATKLLGGDANNDSTISVLDLTCIGGSFGTVPGACAGGGSPDITADGTVNILDLVLMGGNYGLNAPQPW